jgi:hypothetical protein
MGQNMMFHLCLLPYLILALGCGGEGKESEVT